MRSLLSKLQKLWRQPKIKYLVIMALRVTPLPIPNRLVKPYRADGTAGAALWKSRLLPGQYKRNYFSFVFYGGLAQLGEHLPCTQGVKGSSPLLSTIDP